MAVLVKRKNQYLIRFSCGQYCSQRFRSCLTDSLKEAQKIKDRIEETCRDIKLRRAFIPPNVDAGDYIFSGGRLTTAPNRGEIYFLSRAVDDYFAGLPRDAKSPATINLEKTHSRHLLRLLPKNKHLGTFNFDTVQGYINKRREQTYKGERPIQRITIDKEVCTFRLIWNAAKNRGIVQNPFPSRFTWPKDMKKPPFKTCEELRRDSNPDWDTLILTIDEVKQVLREVRECNDCRYIFPLITFVAYTGCRRSEALNARLDDVDFQGKKISIREKKRCKAHSGSMRYVPLATPLASVLREWLEIRSSVGCSSNLFVGQDDKPISYGSAHRALKRVLKKTSFPEIRGFHVFRYSLITGLSAIGIRDGEIDRWVGHTTEEMRNHYRHLNHGRATELLNRLLE